MAKIDLIQQVQNVLAVQYGGTGLRYVVAFADREVPAGTQNGSNTAFTLVNVPSPAFSLILDKNGSIADQTTAYTLAGNTITWSVAPSSGDAIRAWYRYILYSLNLSDGLFVQDSFASGAALGGLHLSDSLSLSDVLAKSGLEQEAPTDSLALSDSISSFMYMRRSLSDSLSLSDAFVEIPVQLNKSLSDSESANWADSFKEVPLQLSERLTDSETTNWTDALSFRPTQLNQAITDSEASNWKDSQSALFGSP